MAKKMIKPSDLTPEQREAFSEFCDSIESPRTVIEAQSTESASQTLDIVERARLVSKADEIAYPDVKYVKSPDGFVATAELTDENKLAALGAIFKGLPEENRPRLDLFRGRCVDHRGIIMDDKYDATDYLKMFSIAGLRKMRLKDTIETVRAYGLKHRSNDLITRLNRITPEWDRTPRMQSYLINLFGSHDTALNRAFGIYFWLALWARMTQPGAYAPMSLVLIGRQHSGKSFFSKLLASTIGGNRKTSAVPLDLSRKHEDFLREITGNSVVANIAEFTGYSKADMNSVKSFLTNNEDTFSYKFEGAVTVARQFICIADWNQYSGLLRDETGNRRWFPQFVGQLPDVAGKKQWDLHTFKANFDGFTADLWQLLAEARHWWDTHAAQAGADGALDYEAVHDGRYRKFVDAVSKGLSRFSEKSVANGDGVVTGGTIEDYIEEALWSVPKYMVGVGKTDQFYPAILTGDLEEELRRLAPHAKLNGVGPKKDLVREVETKRKATQSQMSPMDDGSRPRTWAFKDFVDPNPCEAVRKLLRALLDASRADIREADAVDIVEVKTGKGASYRVAGKGNGQAVKSAAVVREETGGNF